MLNISQNLLSKYEYKLYARHIILPQIQKEGQQRLKNARILFIGLGGLASPALLYLVSAGIGYIGLIDNDQVEISNLQRQIIYQNKNIGENKVSAAQSNIKAINPLCTVTTYNTKFNKYNAYKLVKEYNIIIDSCDNFETRDIISEVCKKLHKIHIYGAISEFEGQVSVFNYQGGPNYNDIYPIKKNRLNENTCNNNGVIGVLPGLIGIIQATETIKIIIGIGNTLNGYLLAYNALHMSFKTLKLRNRYFKSVKSSVKNYKLFQSNRKNLLLNIINFKHKIINELENLYIIDIRTPYEYQNNHIKNAINIPLRKLQSKENIKILRKRSKEKLIIIYCNSISKSQIASAILNKANLMHNILEIILP
uniref:Probable molybdopterin-synthase adenylyltransferase n=1 Tax=Dichotomaria marginata TaxID=268567 RepID=A0A1G4NSV1_9FLOR|nr:Molybdopterin biosynthesis protein [Dichotomaria marginata]SCW21636.1 Molybdopterin biosynthesis protein [Dichotomaria marginata]